MQFLNSFNLSYLGEKLNLLGYLFPFRYGGGKNGLDFYHVRGGMESRDSRKFRRIGPHLDPHFSPHRGNHQHHAS
jgi:hypothetical protein